MNIFIEVLVACVILFCVTLGLFIQYKEDSKSEFEKLPAFDYSYSTGVVTYPMVFPLILTLLRSLFVYEVTICLSCKGFMS